MTNERKSIAQLVNSQHEQSEETEFYPSTQEIVNKAAEWISENGTDVFSVLDIGCGNGAFFEKLDKTDFFYNDDYKHKNHYEQIKLEHFPHPALKGKTCTAFLYPTTVMESLVIQCEEVRTKYLETKDEHYFDILIHLLPNSYKVVKL